MNEAFFSAWHPQTDGHTERVHRALEQLLGTYIQSDKAACEDLLPAVELAYNWTTFTSTGPSSFEVMIRENPLRASDLDFVDAYEPTLTPPTTKLFQRLVDRAYANIIHAQAQQHFTLINADSQQNLKWETVSSFPCRPSPKGQAKAHGRCYAARLGTSRKASKRTEPPHEVEHILDWRTRNGAEEYLMKWKGYLDEDATWEPIQHLDWCKDFLRAFLANRTRQRRRRRREA
ncbi:hypothetical protein Efla_006008 [Eimeria flavescens]